MGTSSRRRVTSVSLLEHRALRTLNTSILYLQTLEHFLTFVATDDCSHATGINTGQATKIPLVSARLELLA